MRRYMKRVLGFLLCLILVLTFQVSPAFATESAEDNSLSIDQTGEESPQPLGGPLEDDSQDYDDSLYYKVTGRVILLDSLDDMNDLPPENELIGVEEAWINLHFDHGGTNMPFAAYTDPCGYFEIYLLKSVIDSYGDSGVSFNAYKRGHSNNGMHHSLSEIRGGDLHILLPVIQGGVLSYDFPAGHLPADDKGYDQDTARRAVILLKKNGNLWLFSNWHSWEVNSKYTYNEFSYVEPGTYKIAFAYAETYILDVPDIFQYYNGKFDRGEADTIVVSAGDEIHVNTVTWDGDRDHAPVDTFPPYVIDFQPGDADNPSKGNMIITFNEKMHATPGEIKLTSAVDSRTFVAGSWSAGNTTYTVPYIGLTAGRLYAVTLSGFSDATGNKMTPDSKYKFAIEGGQIMRELTSGSGGITIAGSITPDATLNNLPGHAHPQGADLACDAIHHADGQGLLLALHDISVSDGSFTGMLTITIPIPAQYNGRKVSILHCKNGVLETIRTVAENNKVTFQLDSLSPIGIVLEDETGGASFEGAGTSAEPYKIGTGGTSPQTGDNTPAELWVVLLAASALGLAGCGTVLWRCKKRGTKNRPHK